MLHQLIAASAACTAVGANEEIEPIIGWCAFYPGVDVGMEHVVDSGATGMSVCAAGLGVEQEEGVFDFGSMEKQISFAEKYGLKLALISELNPFFAPKWMREKMRESGEGVKGYTESEDTRDGSIPSIQSPIFKEAQAEIIRRATEFVCERDTTRAISYYHPGAEWWFLPQYRYNPLDIADFQRWLAAKYGSIDRLNDAWVAEYASFDDVPAPAVDQVLRSKKEMQATVLIEEGGTECAWSTTLSADLPGGAEPSSPMTIPGKTYTFSALARSSDLSAPGASCWILWIDASTGKAIYGAGSVGPAFYGSNDWTRISVTGTAVGSSNRAQLSVKIAGKGEVELRDVQFVEDGSSEDRAPALSADAWRFTKPSEGAHADGSVKEGESLSVSIPRSEVHTLSFANPNAAVGDWADYWYETGAEYINYCSGLFKEMDPSRKTATYLTFAFSFPAEWDYTQWTAIAPDEVAMRGTNIDEIGLQICAADKDPYRIIANLDLIRKYEKTMWAVDLIDFTSGIDIGYPAMDKITQAAVQHGARGLIYCAWHMPSVRDYSYYPEMGVENLNRMLSDARTASGLMDGFSVKADVALVEPILPASPSDAEGFKNDFRSFMGWYKLLERMHKTVDIVTINELSKGADLSRYRWVLVPDCAYIREAALTSLKEYHDGGGLVVTSGRFAEFDEIGRPMSARPALSSIADLGKAYTGEVYRDTHAGNTPPLFLWRADTTETEEAFAAAKASVEGILDRSGIEPGVEVLTDRPGMRMVEYESDGRRAVYLVNMDETPAAGVSIRLRCEVSDVEVFADTAASEAVASTSNGWTELRLPEFRSACIVRLQKSEITAKVLLRAGRYME